MDEIDQGCQREQEDRARALAAQAARPRMQPVGFCYNCGAELEQGLFCDKDCRDDYEARIKLQGINGHV